MIIETIVTTTDGAGTVNIAMLLYAAVIGTVATRAFRKTLD